MSSQGGEPWGHLLRLTRDLPLQPASPCSLRPSRAESAPRQGWGQAALVGCAPARGRALGHLCSVVTPEVAVRRVQGTAAVPAAPGQCLWVALT